MSLLTYPLSLFQKFDEQYAEQAVEHASRLVWHVLDGDLTDDLSSFTGNADGRYGGQVMHESSHDWL